MNAPVRFDEAHSVDEPRIWSKDQSTWLEQHWMIRGELARVIIRRNAYDDQSWFRVDLMSPEARKWNEFCRLWGDEVAAMSISYTEWPLRAGSMNALLATRDALVHRAHMLLSAMSAGPS